MLVDILDYMVPSAAFMQEKHLIGANNNHYTIVRNGQIFYVKSPKGFPWDVNLFDANYVYQYVTENSWTDPAQRKQFASPNWPPYGGIPFAPRFFDPEQPNPPIITNTPAYRIYTDCTNFLPSSLSSVQTKLSGPYIIDFGGDLGLCQTMVVEYQWGMGLKTLECFFYAKGFGWVKWTTSLLQNGIYIPQKQSLFNIIGTGVVPLVYPCNVP